MSSTTSVFHELDTIKSCQFTNALPKPSYHDKNSIIIAPDEGDGIYEYNFDTNEMKLIIEYEPETEIFLHGQFIDPQSNILYVFGADCDKVYKFDLKNKTISHTSNILSLGTTPKCIYIPEINQIHISNIDEHIVYNINDKSIIRSLDRSIVWKHVVCWPKILYIPLTKKLTVFGSNVHDEIYNCDVNENIYEYKWKLNDITMPYSICVDLYDLLLAFKQLLFCFYFTEDAE
eukprot:144515_1